MFPSKNQPSSAISEAPKAVLLCAEMLTSEDRHLTEILDFLGIPWQILTPGEVASFPTPVPGTGKFCILGSFPLVVEALRDSQHSGDCLPAWIQGASSVFLYGFEDTVPCTQLLHFLTENGHSNVRHLNAAQTAVTITDDLPEMCGPMSGLQVLVERSEGDVVFDIAMEAQRFRSIIRSNAGQLFLSVTKGGVPFYLSGGTITDIRSPHGKYFDVKEHFCGAVPAVMYLKWAFREVCWNSFEASGCLIIDDPPLKPRYGFLRYREALELMDRHNFTTTIAFIPWNWRRTNSRTVSIFRNRPDRLSLCVHGSDHVGSEFATRSAARLNRSAKTARQRMELLEQKTALPYARVMVFPRGEFSPEAGGALKSNGFMAAVNTEVAPPELAENKTTIADLWSMAIMKYGTFPVFTRRYLKHGIENFAFDGLLGKPCLIVGHHEVFKDGGRELVEFIDKLNALKWNLRWKPLDDLILHSFRIRNAGEGKSVIQMFAQGLRIENSGEPREYTFLKEEDPDSVKAVAINRDGVEVSCDRGFLCWNATLAPSEIADVRVIINERQDSDFAADGIGYSIKTRARRYLSELRDNYLCQSNFLSESAARIRGLLK
ncbi:MAG TPA: hypothetical protein VI431_00965 [Candidatus Acidoferrum sp.]